MPRPDVERCHGQSADPASSVLPRACLFVLADPCRIAPAGIMLRPSCCRAGHPLFSGRKLLVARQNILKFCFFLSLSLLPPTRMTCSKGVPLRKMGGRRAKQPTDEALLLLASPKTNQLLRGRQVNSPSPLLLSVRSCCSSAQQRSLWLKTKPIRLEKIKKKVRPRVRPHLRPRELTTAELEV